MAIFFLSPLPHLCFPSCHTCSQLCLSSHLFHALYSSCTHLPHTSPTHASPMPHTRLAFTYLRPPNFTLPFPNLSHLSPPLHSCLSLSVPQIHLSPCTFPWLTSVSMTFPLLHTSLLPPTLQGPKVGRGKHLCAVILLYLLPIIVTLNFPAPRPLNTLKHLLTFTCHPVTAPKSPSYVRQHAPGPLRRVRGRSRRVTKGVPRDWCGREGVEGEGCLGRCSFRC